MIILPRTYATVPIFCIFRVWLTCRKHLMLYWSAFNKHLTKLLRHSFRRTESLHTPHFLLKHLRDGTQLSVSNPHPSRASHVRLQLRLHAIDCRQSRHSYNLPFGVGQHVACENVAKQMRFKIIVNSRSKSVVKRLSAHPSLHHGALFQSVVIIRQRRGVAAHLHAPVFFLRSATTFCNEASALRLRGKPV